MVRVASGVIRCKTPIVFTYHNTFWSRARSMADLLPIRNGEIELWADRAVVIVGGRSVRLTRAELLVLGLLMRSPERVFSASEIVGSYAEDGTVSSASAVRVMIHRIRRKLGEEGARLVSVRSMGWALVSAESLGRDAAAAEVAAAPASGRADGRTARGTTRRG